MGQIYEVRCGDGLRFRDIDTKFHRDRFRHSKVNKGGGPGFTEIQSAWRLHKPILGK
jgi:hypothetical protein